MNHIFDSVTPPPPGNLPRLRFFALTGNGLVLSEDLARRFICVELDARCEDPEQRSFPRGFLEDIGKRRPELLTAGLIVLRWGRQNPLKHGKPLGSFEDWGVWVRDPLVALGCRDPVDRISEIKARDPERQRVIGLFAAWHEAHEDNAVKVAELAEAVRLTADPSNRGRQYLARAIGALAGTRLGGFVLDRLEPTNNRKEGARYRLLLSDFDSNASASSASSGRNADAADDADDFGAPPEPICAQCGGGVASDPPSDPPTDKVTDKDGITFWLHRECRRFWKGDE